MIHRRYPGALSNFTSKTIEKFAKNDDPLTMGVKHHCQFDSCDCQVKNDCLIQFASEPAPVWVVL